MHGPATDASDSPKLQQKTEAGKTRQKKFSMAHRRDAEKANMPPEALQYSSSSDEGISDEGISFGGGSSLQHAGDDDTPEAPSSGFLTEGHAAAAGESLHPSLLFQWRS